MSDATNDTDMAKRAEALLTDYRIKEAELEREQEENLIRLDCVRDVIARLTGRRIARRGRRATQWPAAVPDAPDTIGDPMGNNAEPPAAA